MARILCLNTEKEIKDEFKRIGVHPGGIRIMTPKARSLLVLIKVDNRAANILKQEMLSCGGEVALPKEAYTLSGKKIEVIINGNTAQLNRLVEKLSKQAPFGLLEAGIEIKKAIENFSNPLKRKIGNKRFDFSKKAYLMGILNVTPDSFSDGGKFFDSNIAISHAKQMVKDGADIIDVGGESTRPGSKPVSAKEEVGRVIPVIKAISKEINVPVSIDTSKAEVAEKAVSAGAAMINDVTGLRNSKMVRLATKKNLPVVIMHMLGKPRTMQDKPEYKDVVSDIYTHLERQAKKVIAEGLSPENVYIDLGIGFGKTVDHNLELIRRIAEFKSMGFPIVFGPSRKSFIGMILGTDTDDRLEGTAASVVLGIANGASIIRVHDVKEMKRVAMVTERIIGR